MRLGTITLAWRARVDDMEEEPEPEPEAVAEDEEDKEDDSRTRRVVADRAAAAGALANNLTDPQDGEEPL